MEILEISKKTYNNLKFYDCGTEGNLYKLDTKNGWDHRTKLLKKLFLDSGETFGNKMMTVNSLVDNRNNIDIDELILPEKFAVVQKQIVGLILPFIESTNLKTVLDDYNISNEEKINYLRQIGYILKKVEKLRHYSQIPDFYLGDIHEYNFIVDKEKRVDVVDLDSCRILGNQPFPCKYLVTNKSVEEFPAKYPIGINGLNTVNKDTDLLCYNIMILNFLARTDVTAFDLKQFYTYLNYLGDIKTGHNLLDSFGRIYTNKENINPVEYLDEVPELIGKANYKVFKTKYRLS